jgi:hypothetical protein
MGQLHVHLCAASPCSLRGSTDSYWIIGKVIAEGLVDVQEAVDIAFYMAGEGRRLQKAQIDK